MSKFTFTKCKGQTGREISGLCVITPTVFGDSRGYFMETYNAEFDPYIKHLDGTQAAFVQDNESYSSRGVLRGLHMQMNNPQGKLVRVISGEVFDVAVDARKGSKTFGQWFGLTLSGENKKQFYIPEGFLHGFLVLSDTAAFAYKCTRLYEPSDETGVLWNDPDIGIKWPLDAIDKPVLSDKDKNNFLFKELARIIK
jgi:dTDP-4-dehydrorhamnose 3,5-epimerase